LYPFFKKWTSPNFEARAGGQAPSMIVLHYTGMQSARAALERLCDPDSKVSAHYLIEENGRIHQLVPEDKRAWHAGKSYWAGESDINSASIGIEIVNPGHEFGYRAFPEKQIRSVIKLCRQIVDKYNISPANILAHSDIAPARKTDPGELFPWETLAAQGVGLWPRPQEMDYQAAEDLILNPAALREQFTAFGYDPEPDFDVVLQAFHRHFYPERLGAPADILTAAKILALLRQARE